MCGISGIINHPQAEKLVLHMIQSQHQRGPDAQGVFSIPEKGIVLGHNRLSIIDLSSFANQPMFSRDKRHVIIFNGEIYNYLELKRELSAKYTFSTQSDTEVLLAAYQEWGHFMLPKLNGMFALAIYDTLTDEIFLARDRFGVKPLYYAFASESFLFASEIKAIHSTGLVPKIPNKSIWYTYFSNGLYDHTSYTFWQNIQQLPAGCYAFYGGNRLYIHRWYDLLENIVETDTRDENVILDELLYLLEDSIKLRFRADVPVGICLSGGLDSSLLLALVDRVKGKNFPLHAFTFYTGDNRYDELPWVEKMIETTRVIHHPCLLSVSEIPTLAEEIARRMDEPYGGIPTLGMSKVFQKASEQGIKVLLDGNGMDEAWGGYEYYARPEKVDLTKGPVQGSVQSHTLSNYFKKSIGKFPGQIITYTMPSVKSPITTLQFRDLLYAKIPRAMRFADRNSMTYSLELREPFLDYRLVELGLRQPAENKVRNGETKYLVRCLAEKIIPKKISEAPKRPLQTPQREWLAKELSPWISSLLHKYVHFLQEWFEPESISEIYQTYCAEKPDNSFYIWQLLNSILLLNNE